MAVAVVAGCTDPCPPKRKSHVGNRVWKGTDLLHRARRSGGVPRAQGTTTTTGRRHFVPSSPHPTLAAPDANDGLRPCPDVSLLEAAAVFVASEPARQQQLARGWLPGRPAVGVQCAVHKMPISVGQRPRETKHGKCDLARDPNPATCKKLPPVIQIPESCSSRFSRLNIALQ